MIHGVYRFVLRDRHGRVLRRGRVDNTTMLVGQNLMLSTLLTGSAYTVTGPYMSLIGNTPAFSAIAATDIMTNHPGWGEATSFGGTRPIASSWGPPSSGSISLATPVSFTAAGSEIINGVFLVLGPAASATAGNTGGTLLSAAQILPQSWTVGQTLSFNYTMSLSGAVGAVMDSVASGLTAAGTNQATSYQLTAQFNEVLNVAPGTGVALLATTPGDHCIIHNASSKTGSPNALNLYPPKGSSAALNDFAVGAAMVLLPGQSVYFEQLSATQWYSDP